MGARPHTFKLGLHKATETFAGLFTAPPTMPEAADLALCMHPCLTFEIVACWST